MKEHSRREFLHCCLCLAGSGAVAAYFPSLAGCEERNPGGAGGKVRSENRPAFEAAYVKLQQSGELKRRGEGLWRMMAGCELCPRMCGVNRLDGEKGFCQSSSRLEVSAFHPHFGEERSLVGKGGSGAIFLTNCGLKCIFCINWQISQEGEGADATIQELADMMLRLQAMGCPNINFVTPTHYAAHIVLAVDIAASKGLRIPLVYNTCGWERVEILQRLEGIVDIYLPDFKYADGRMASLYSSGAGTYPEISKKALIEMHRRWAWQGPRPTASCTGVS
jgi:putative pyruvate formate lyase activating enzyme